MKTLTPAFGADYKTKKEVIEAFEGGKDFINHDITDQWNGLPCSKADLVNYINGEDVKIRYNKLSKFIVYKIK